MNDQAPISEVIEVKRIRFKTTSAGKRVTEVVSAEEHGQNRLFGTPKRTCSTDCASYAIGTRTGS